MRAAILLSVLAFAAEAGAQWSGSAALLSDYRFRGVSQSDRRPAVQASVGFDHSSGLFAGLFVSSADFNGASSTNLETLAYAGIARRFATDWSWEAGGTHYRYPGFRGRRDPDFSELFLGITWRDLNSRLYYTNEYFGRRIDSFYVELNGTQPLVERTALFWHLGLERVFGRARADLRFGVAIERAPFTIELSAVASDAGSGSCPRGGDRCRPGLIVALSRSF